MLESLFAYVEIISVHALQLDRYRVFPGLQVVDIAYSMGGQVRMPILEAGNLVLPIQTFELELSMASFGGTAPLI